MQAIKAPTSNQPAISEQPAKQETNKTSKTTTNKQDEDFNWEVDRFADIKVLRYKVPGFETLPLKQKKLLYFLSEAALVGRDIVFDQNYHLNLTIRRTLEEVVKHYQGDRNSDLYQRFMVYTKRVWFAGGIHHHYSNNKFKATFTSAELK